MATFPLLVTQQMVTWLGHSPFYHRQAEEGSLRGSGKVERFLLDAVIHCKVGSALNMTDSSFKTAGGGEEGGGVQDELLSSTREREVHDTESYLHSFVLKNRLRRGSATDTGLQPADACGCLETMKPPRVTCCH